jgi:Iap family predicted aminopeptidase
MRPPPVLLFLSGLFLSASVAYSQEGAASSAVQELATAVRNGITPAGLREHAEAIVRYERPSGSPGENAAIDHIVTSLREAGVPVEVHTFQAYTSDPVAAAVEVPSTGFAPEAITVAFSGAANRLEAPLVDVGTLSDLPELEVGTGERLALPDEGNGVRADPRLAAVRGAIALVEGQPRNVSATVLARLGAVGVIFVNPEERLNDLIVTTTWGNPSLRNAHRLPDLPVVQVKKSAGDQLRELLAREPIRVRISAQVETGWRPLRLVVARIPGPDPEAPFALLGGHIDAWYHGATDEGASNAAMVELAKGFHRHRDHLRRGLVVAWWPGHSNGRYAGSTWYADQFFDELRRRGVAYLNVDGIGQMGAKRFGANTTASLEQVAIDAVRNRVGVKIQPRRPGRNSDQSFNGIGLPLLQLNHSRLPEDGGYWWWHTPEDTFDKIDFEVLKTDTDLYVDALARLLAAPRFPVDLVAEVRGLGEELAARQQVAGDRLALAEVWHRHERLLDLVSALHASGGVPTTPDADLALLRILRPLHRVLYTPLDPYHPDPGVESGLLQGFSAVEILGREQPGSSRYRFAETSLLRERNRLLEALDEAIREAAALYSATIP